MYSTTLDASSPPPTRPRIQSIVSRAPACNRSLRSAYRASSRPPKTMWPTRSRGSRLKSNRSHPGASSASVPRPRVPCWASRSPHRVAASPWPAWAPAVVVTVHPSAVLRADDGERYFDMLVADLKLAGGSRGRQVMTTCQSAGDRMRRAARRPEHRSSDHEASCRCIRAVRARNSHAPADRVRTLGRTRKAFMADIAIRVWFRFATVLSVMSKSSTE